MTTPLDNVSGTNLEITYIDAGNVTANEALLKKYVAPALGPELDLDDLMGRIADQRTLAFVVEKPEGGPCAVITCKLIEHPMERHLFVHTLAGDDFASWHEELTEVLVRHALDNGCDRITTHARSGLARMLKGTRWHQVGVVLSINLGH